MGRWTVHRHHPNEKFFFVIDGDTCVISNLIKSEANAVTAAHNAKIAELEAMKEAYEIRLSDVAESIKKYTERLDGFDLCVVLGQLDRAVSELARVKAESLRVVPVEPAESSIAYDWYMTRDGELGWHGADKDSHECVETPEGYHFLGDCKPVRIERWEDEG